MIPYVRCDYALRIGTREAPSSTRRGCSRSSLPCFGLCLSSAQCPLWIRQWILNGCSFWPFSLAQIPRTERPEPWDAQLYADRADLILGVAHSQGRESRGDRSLARRPFEGPRQHARAQSVFRPRHLHRHHYKNWNGRRPDSSCSTALTQRQYYERESGVPRRHHHSRRAQPGKRFATTPIGHSIWSTLMATTSMSPSRPMRNWRWK